jgi:hypothetical protein
MNIKELQTRVVELEKANEELKIKFITEQNLTSTLVDTLRSGINLAIKQQVEVNKRQRLAMEKLPSPATTRVGVKVEDKKEASPCPVQE